MCPECEKLPVDGAIGEKFKGTIYLSDKVDPNDNNESSTARRSFQDEMRLAVEARKASEILLMLRMNKHMWSEETLQNIIDNRSKQERKRGSGTDLVVLDDENSD